MGIARDLRVAGASSIFVFELFPLELFSEIWISLTSLSHARADSEASSLAPKTHARVSRLAIKITSLDYQFVDDGHHT
jgi:hypothetical protein